MCCGSMPDHCASVHNLYFSRGWHYRFGLSFWNKKKKIEMLENCLNAMRQETKEIEELIAELKAEK